MNRIERLQADGIESGSIVNAAGTTELQRKVHSLEQLVLDMKTRIDSMAADLQDANRQIALNSNTALRQKGIVAAVQQDLDTKVGSLSKIENWVRSVECWKQVNTFVVSHRVVILDPPH